MKVPSLVTYYYYIAIDKTGKEYKISGDMITGCWEMVFELERSFGIKTSTATVYKAKNIFTPIKFPYLTKSQKLAWCNWVLFFPKDQREKFFSEEKDIQRFYKNNPIVDIKIGLSRESIETDYVNKSEVVEL